MENNSKYSFGDSNDEAEKELTLVRILKKSQKALKLALAEELERLGYTDVRALNGFLYAPGELPVLLVAHLDTVHHERVKTICRSADGRVLMSPEGIGGDDRAGVYMILNIVRSRRCHVLFCEDEEAGGIGARAFTRSKIRPAVNYIVEMDRRGANDAVFYGCANAEFTDFICGFGFDEAQGSFSDISILAPHLGVAAVNISACYYNEHRLHETIDLEAMEYNISRISEMVETSTGHFAYVARQYFGGRYEEMTLWDLAGGHAEPSSKRLMPLPDDAVLKFGGEEMCDCSSYMIDYRGRVYNYIGLLDVATLSENAAAYSPSGKKIPYKASKALPISVLPLEEALELMDAI